MSGKKSSGRPTKYNTKLIEEVIKYVGELGKSVTQFARHIRVSKSTVYKWAEEHPEFSDALTLAQEWSQAHWEDKLEDMMYSREVNAPLVKLYFANRFKWSDKPADEGDDAPAPSLNISFEVREPVDTVTVTNAKP